VPSAELDYFSHDSPTDSARELVEALKAAEILRISVKKIWNFEFNLFWRSVMSQGDLDYVIQTREKFSSPNLTVFSLSKREENPHLLRSLLSL